MSLSERGLWISIYMECWPNKSTPSDVKQLSRYLGLEESDTKSAFTENVKSFFKVSNGEIISIELEDYRQEIIERRKKQSAGGKHGAEKKRMKNNPDSRPKGTPEGIPEGSLGYVTSDQVRSGKVNSSPIEDYRYEDLEEFPFKQ